MSDYFIRGTDGVDYPATLADVRAWLAEARVSRDQHVYDTRAAKWVTVAALVDPPSPKSEEFFVRGKDGTNYPADLAALRAWAAQGRLVPQQLVYDPRVGQWVTAERVVGANAFPYRAPSPPRRRSVLGLLASALAIVLTALLAFAAWQSLGGKSATSASGGAAAPVPKRDLPLNQWVNDGPYGGGIDLLVISPADSNRILAASENSVFLTTDGAASWKRVLRAPALDVKALRFSPDGRTAYAGGKALYRSADAGATWTEVAAVRSVTSLAVATNGVYAKSETLDGNELLSSADGGATWSPRTLLDTTENLFAFGERVYAIAGSTLQESTDGARTWRRLPMPGKDVQDVAFSTPSTVWVSTIEGLLRSADLGATWSEVPQFSKTKLYDVVAEGKTVLVQDDTGFHRSEDGGATWSQMSRSAEKALNTVALTPAAPDVVIASAYDHHVYKSTDRGAGWSRADSGLTAVAVGRVVAMSGGRVASETGASVDVASRTEGWRNALYVASPLAFSEFVMRLDAGGDHLYAFRGLVSPRVERSTDGGATWSAWGPAGTLAIARDPKVPARVYATTETGLQVTNDDGGSWEVLSPTKVMNLLFSGDGKTIYGHATGESAMRQSSDGGRTWRVLGDPEMFYHATLTADGRVCVAAPRGVGCLREGSIDWYVANGLPEESQITAVAAHPTDAKILLAGTEKSGVFITRDGGASWTRFGPEDGPMHIRRIVFDAEDPSYVHVATTGESVFSMHTAWQ